MKKVVATFVALAAGALPAGAGAHVISGKPSLTIHRTPALFFNAGARVIVYGQLRSSHAACRAGRTVQLFGVTGDQSRLLGRDVTDREGEYRFVLRAKTNRTFRAVFAGSFVSSYGHSHRCAATSSARVAIKVRRD